MYARTSFRGVKTCKWGGGVFLVILTFFGKDIRDKLKKNACKNGYLGSIFRAVASLTVPGGQEFHFPHFFLKF